MKKYNADHSSQELNHLQLADLASATKILITMAQAVNNVGKMAKALGVNCNIGGKSVNQDTFFVHRNFVGPKRTALLAVLDGHGEKGEVIAEFVKKNLPIKLEEEVQKTGGSTENTAVSCFAFVFR